MRRMIAAAAAAVLLLPVGGQPSAAGQIGGEAWSHVSDISTAKKNKKAAKAPKKEQYMRAAPSGPPSGR